jgi:peptidoglycan/xylan/chitin deacetylase (PgdA/CDA1 family)
MNFENNSIYIVMYHYVRPIKKSIYPNLKGLELTKFYDQINFLTKKFNILSHDELFEIIKTKKIPNKPSVFLTFDDGYIDHYKYVFPYLKKKKIVGSFYPPVKAIQNKIILDPNKIHFILEKEKNIEKIFNEIKYILKKKFNKNLEDFSLEKIELTSKFDDKKTSLIKKLLQYHFPEKIRKYILDKLFAKIINISIKDFSKTLYMNKTNIQEMMLDNMDFGLHGDDHFRWGKLNKDKQEHEIKSSLNFLNKIYKKRNNYSACYPYGSYNNTSLDLLKKHKISFALTTDKNFINKKNIKNHFILPRLDTNDLL